MVDDDDARDNIAANVGRLLKDRGMSQRALAEATGDSPMRISHYVRGAKLPGAAALSRIAEALGVTMESLVSRPPRKNSKTRLAS